MDGRDVPERIERAENEILITLRGFDRRYSIDGKLLNAEKVEKAEREYTIEHGTGYELYYMADKILKQEDLKKLRGPELHEVYLLLTNALERNISDSYKAKVHRCLGEVIESKGDAVEALKQYKMAIKYDPKVGVKRALDRLEKALKSTRGPP